MKHRIRISLVLILGLLLIAAGLIGLAAVPGLVQYAFPMPAESSPDPLQQLESLRASLKDVFPALTLHSVRSGASLTAGSASRNDVALYGIAPGWHEVCPVRMLSGRPVSRLEAEQGEKVIVLDEHTAFQLFGTRDAVGRAVTLDDQTLEVIGIAAHSRRIGETGEAAAWVPLAVVGQQADLMILTARASASQDAAAVFRTAAEEAFGAGTYISLPKEAMRGTMILRWPIIILAVVLLISAGRRLAVSWGRQFRRIAEERRHRYAGRLIPFAAARLAPVLGLTLLLIALGGAAAFLAVQPARVFPEWIPESLGDFSKWGTLFWNLSDSFSAPFSARTPELVQIRFWSALLRWGVVLTLLGALLSLWHSRKKRADNGAGSRQPDT